jgi:hypothetical protein
MKHRESRSVLARMKYVGTFQVRAGLATKQIADQFERGRISYARGVKGVNARNRE